MPDAKRGGAGDAYPLGIPEQLEIPTKQVIARQAALTRIHPPDWLEKIKRYRPGQACWPAGNGRVCRDCVFWENCGRPSGFYPAPHLIARAPRPRACRQFRLIKGYVGPVVPAEADACRYFKEIKHG